MLSINKNENNSTLEELDIIFGGERKIDVNDMKKYCLYRGYDPSELLIQWFWDYLFEFSQEKLEIFLQFVTGSRKVPMGGFAHLRITINNVLNDSNLPISHTCTMELDIPCYNNKETLCKKFDWALKEGIGFFLE